MKRLDITELPDGNRVVSGVTDIFEDCPLVVKAGDRVWHALNYGQECTFRVTITGPGDVSVWHGDEQVLPEPEAQPAPESAPEPEAEPTPEPEPEPAVEPEPEPETTAPEAEPEAEAAE